MPYVATARKGVARDLKLPSQQYGAEGVLAYFEAKAQDLASYPPLPLVYRFFREVPSLPYSPCLRFPRSSPTASPPRGISRHCCRLQVACGGGQGLPHVLPALARATVRYIRLTGPPPGRWATRWASWTSWTASPVPHHDTPRRHPPTHCAST
jgi:hypothetical protein